MASASKFQVRVGFPVPGSVPARACRQALTRRWLAITAIRASTLPVSG